MVVRNSQIFDLQSDQDIVRVRQVVRITAEGLHFSLIAQTKLVTAASELARNTIKFGGGGIVQMETLEEVVHWGVRLTFTDHGPGIPNIEKAMEDGYSTGNGLGLGLGGSKRLVNEFEITSEQGKGTCVRITMWK